MNKERFKDIITGIREIFAARPSEAEQAWSRKQTRAAVNAVDKIPVGDIEVLTNNPTARRLFMQQFNTEIRLENRLRSQKISHGIEDPTHDLQTEFDTDF